MLRASILIVDDEKNTREGLEQVLEENYDVMTARDAEEAFQLMDQESFNVILTDLRMAGKSGLKVIDKAIGLPYKPVCIMMTAYGNVETAVEAMKRGAFDFLTKPLNIEKLEILIQRALETKRIKQENLELHKKLDKQSNERGIVGNSKALKAVIAQVEQVAPSKATVLLVGETGTGKELIAHMIHQKSPRAGSPFVAVHCAALPANLLESELFGHEKGAFTGAVEKRVGRFEAAHKGTLFLDEIGEIDASTQVKLLRFLETKSFERVGSTKNIDVDARLICATNRDLESMVRKGTFREDLLYRLNVITLQLPALRDRKEDISQLLDYYIKYFSEENGVMPPQLTPSALDALQKYPWPGNIRELKNFCENIVIFKRNEVVNANDLEIKYLQTTSNHTNPEKITSTPPLVSRSLEENEKEQYRRALEEAKGNRTQAASILGVSRRTFQRKLLLWPDIGSK